MSTPAGAALPQSSASVTGQKYPPYFWPQIIPYLILLGTSYSIFAFSVDDPYITFRYAANLLAGHGAVFNSGEHVEGFSSPLHLILSVLLLKIAPHADILFKAKLLSLAFGLIGLRLTWDAAMRTHLTRGETIAVQLLVALNMGYALASVNGLETTLYTCVVLATVLAFLREEQARGGNKSALWLAVAVLTRPDALLLFVALLLLRFIWAGRGLWSGRSVLEWSSFFLCPVCLLLLGRLSYYGVLMPNTYYAKDLPLHFGITRGYFYLSHAFAPWSVGFASFWTPQAAPLIKWQSTGAWLFWGMATAGIVTIIRQRCGQTLLVLVIAQILFILRVGGDWMDGWRFMVPVLPLIAILQCHGLRAIYSFARSDAGKRRGRITALGLTLTIWLAFFCFEPHLSWGSAHYTTQGRQLLSASGLLGQRWVVTGDYIKRSLPFGASVAYSEVGYAGYINRDKTFVDTRGITDRQIARMPAIYKAPWGVTDYRWYQPGDPLCNLLQQKRPVAIIDFDPQGQMPLLTLGRYVYTAAVAAPEYPRYPALVYLAP